MTSLQIVPKWKDKSARFKGTVAAGEHVAVSIVNDNGEGGAYVASTEHLRLRVVGPDGRVLAQFPMPEDSTEAEDVLPTSELEGEGEGETEDANTWDSDTTPLQCELNLNTVQMLRAVPPGSNVPLLFVLDDIDAKTLYFKEFCEVTHWPRRCGEDEPVDLDGYADFVANITEELASHAGNTNNPHEVTKAQIGLGNVDNTSDEDKPISAAVAAALALKYAKPGTGIPKSDLADDVKTSLGKADTALQSHQDISGKADLVGGKVPASQLPAYVDDVLEYDSISEFPATGEEGKIYVDKSTNRTYRWSGTQYTEIANPALDNAVTHNSANGVKSSGVWAAIWGALTALPTGFTSLYDWCVSQLAGKANASHTHGQSDVTGLADVLAGKVDKSAVDPMLFAQYYPDGNVKSAADFTSGIKYNAPDTTNRTIKVKPFCNTGDSEDDNSGLVGRVVIPPFVDAGGNPYISDDGTRYKVVGVSGGSLADANANLTTIVAPITLTTIGSGAFSGCSSLTSVPLPAATTVGSIAFVGCSSLTSVSLPAATTIGSGAFSECASLTSVSLPAATTIGSGAFSGCPSLTSVSLPAATTIGSGAFSISRALTSVDFGATPRSSVPSLGLDAFYDVPSTCQIIVPYAQYDAWIAASGWSDLEQGFVRHAEKADKPATFTTGNLAALDAQGNPTDSTIPAANVATKGDLRYDLGTPVVIATASSETVEGETVYYGAATLADRTANIVQVTATLDELRITFPAATSGKVRDFGLRVEIGTGSAALAAPALVPVAPTGETITLENADGEIPAFADGTATAKGVTLLYFSETAPGVFLVKGEQIQEVA